MLVTVIGSIWLPPWLSNVIVKETGGIMIHFAYKVVLFVIVVEKL